MIEKGVIYLVETTIGMFIVMLIMLWARSREKKRYNNGICINCGNKLRHFDVDSQGGRGYCCDKCHYHTWVSYDIDKNHNS